MNTPQKWTMAVLLAAALSLAMPGVGLWAAPPDALPPGQGLEVWEPQISIVWPHDPRGIGGPLERSTLVNVSVWPRGQMACNVLPGIQMLQARDGQPIDVVVGRYETRSRPTTGGTFASLEFNDILSNIRDNPAARFAFVTYREEPPGRLGFVGNVWVHATDPRSIVPQPVVPTGHSLMVLPGEFDTRIQIVWPRDQLGRFQPVERADFVNVAVEVFEHNTLRAAIPDARGVFPFTLTLYMAEGNSPLQPVDRVAHEMTYTVGSEVYPRWAFNNVEVRPGAQTHFLVGLLQSGARAESRYTNIWTHAVEGRTLLPAPQPPPPCRSSY